MKNRSVKPLKPNIPAMGKHKPSKPRLKTRHLSTIGKSAFGAPDPTAGMAFPPGAGAPAGAPAFAPGDPGAPQAAPPDAGALAGAGGGPPGM